jgi:hypothetical protein
MKVKQLKKHITEKERDMILWSMPFIGIIIMFWGIVDIIRSALKYLLR